MVKELSKLQSEELSLRLQNKILAREILNGGGGSVQNLNSMGGRGSGVDLSSSNKRGRYKKKVKEAVASFTAKASMEGKDPSVQAKSDSMNTSPENVTNVQIVKDGGEAMLWYHSHYFPIFFLLLVNDGGAWDDLNGVLLVLLLQSWQFLVVKTHGILLKEFYELAVG